MKVPTKYISVISLILSVIVSWMLFPITTGFPMIPVALLFMGLSSLIYWVKKDKTWLDSVLYIGVFSLSFFTVYRANGFLQFFDFISIIFLIAVLVRSLINIPDIFHLLLSPLVVFFNTLLSENTYTYTFTPGLLKRKNNLKEYALTSILTLVVMLITIPLLASANPLFNKMLAQVFTLLNAEWVLRMFLTDSLGIYIIRIIAFLFFAYMIPRALTVTGNGVKDLGSFPTFPINYRVPKIILGGTLIVFFITQLQLYFATPELLRSLGYTNSRLTNEVFAQVTFVAFIILLLTYFDKSRKKWNMTLTYILLLEAFFLIGIAFKSVYDYSFLYGFTEKRLWGYASMTWLTGVLSIYAYHFYKYTSLQSFMKQILAFSVLVIFFINLLNFDYIIYHTAKPTTPEGIDYRYISRTSVDGHYYREVLPTLVKEIEKNNTLDQSKVVPAMRIIRGIESLRYKYGQKMNGNAFNFSEYQEYVATRDMNIEMYEKLILDKQQQTINAQSGRLIRIQ